MQSQPNNDIHRVIHSAVQKTLSRYLSADQVAAGLDIWETKYFDQHLNGLIGFLRDLGKTTRLSQTETQSLRMELYRSLFEINTVSHPKKDKSAAKSSDNVSMSMLRKQETPATPEQIVFGKLCKGIVEGAQKVGFTQLGDFKAAVNEHLSSAKLPPLVRRNIAEWIDHKNELLAPIIPAHCLPHIVNILYIALCEAVGPSVADAMLNQAVKQAENLPEARHYSPKRLL